MRLKKLVKNSLTSVISYGILFIFSILLRKVFLSYLGVEYLGYESLFADIFTILSMAEMGVGTSIINYHLYRAYAGHDEDEISKLMEIYKKLYRVIGIIILTLGVLFSFFLEFIISGNYSDWSFIRIIYFIQLGSTLCTYFLAYNRAAFSADQNSYILVRVDTATNVAFNIIKIFSIIVWKNYVIYLFLTVVRQIISNLIIYYRRTKKYPYIKKEIITVTDIKKRNLFSDVKNFLFHQIAGTVFWGTDSIIISKFLGIGTLGYYNNYVLIKNQIRTIIVRIFQPFQSTVGNLVYSNDSSRKTELFYVVDMLSFFLAAFIGIGTIVLIQPCIRFLFGEKYLIDNACAYLLGINLFIEIIREFQSYFRMVYGEYEKDRKYVLIASVVNLAFSIVLVQTLGLPGVLFGTLLGNCVIWYGNVVFLKPKYMTEKASTYIVRHMGWFSLAFIEAVITYKICALISGNLTALLLGGLVCLIIPNSLNLLLFWKSSSLQYFMKYIKNIKERKQNLK